jgi:hypothetical protein
MVATAFRHVKETSIARALLFAIATSKRAEPVSGAGNSTKGARVPEIENAVPATATVDIA